MKGTMKVVPPIKKISNGFYYKDFVEVGRLEDFLRGKFQEAKSKGFKGNFTQWMAEPAE